MTTSAKTETDRQNVDTPVEAEPPALTSLHKVLWTLLGINALVLVMVFLTVPVLGPFPGATFLVLLAALGVTHIYEWRQRE